MVAVLKSLAEFAAPPGVALSELEPGVPARVLCVLGQRQAAPVDVSLRLAELGFLPGEQVRIVARGFLAGEPLAVRIGTGTFALRRFEAAVIRVMPESVARG
ncbi:MAG: ferrous iron transport protein A [Proteobacteria bacterium]|nr:ferrous iron transport protein A [Pseudomonadota bacterium]